MIIDLGVALTGGAFILEINKQKRPFLPPLAATRREEAFCYDGEREKNDSGHAGGRQAVQGNISGAGHRGLCAEGVCA